MMNYTLLLLISAILLSLSSGVYGIRLQTIDTFANTAGPLIFVVPGGTVDQTWYSPYYPSIAAPAVQFFTTSNAIGGQRDLVIGHVAGNSTVGSVAICSVIVSSRIGSVAFPLEYDGGAFYQWDGDDSALPSAGGAALTPSFTTDFDATLGGRAQGFLLSVTSDHDVRYYLTVINIGLIRNQVTFIQPQNENTFQEHILSFDDPRWDVPGYDFTRIRGIEVSVQTGVGQISEAVDTAFEALVLYSYEITGNVILQCNCGTTDPEDPFVFAETIDLRFQGSSTLLDTTDTDINGDYIFFGLDPGNYQVCIRDTTVLLCSGSPRCRTVTIDTDPKSITPAINFVETSPSVFTIPDDATYDCEDCRFPDGTQNCPEYATLVGCLGDESIVTTYTDLTTTNACGTTIVRTWINPDGPDDTQTLFFVDSDGPQFVSLPQDRTYECNDIQLTFFDWLDADAFSTAIDNCGNYEIVDNWFAIGQPVPNSCNSITITFTAVDDCGNVGESEVATYATEDNGNPSIVSFASDEVRECSAKTNNVNSALTAWVNRNGDFEAQDECSSVTYTDDFSGGLSVNSCFDSITVEFFATDACGNQISDIGSFTVQDTTSPSFTTLPSNRNYQCNGAADAEDDFDSWLATSAGARVTDLCVSNDNTLIINNNYDGNFDVDLCGDSITVTFSVFDFCDNSPAIATATWTVTDSSVPTFVTLPSNAFSECDLQSSSNSDDYNDWLGSVGFTGSAIDACSGTDIIYTHDGDNAIPDQGCGDSSVITFTATDLCGRSDTEQATYSIFDTTDPVWDTDPSNVEVECGPDTGDDYDFWLSTVGLTGFATDSCTLVTYTNTALPVVTGCDVDNSVTFFATDECGNRPSGRVAVFTVVDTTAPFITNFGQSLDIECDANSQFSYSTWLNTIAGTGDGFDDCTLATWSHDGPLTLLPQLTCVVSFDVEFFLTDACGLSDSFIQDVTITDSFGPTLLSEAVDQDIQCNFATTPTSATQYANWVNANGFANAVDDCSSVAWDNDAVSVLSQPDLCFATTTVTFIATDSCGQFVETTATYTVRDTTSPVIVVPAQTETVQCDPSTNSNSFFDYVENHGNSVITDTCSTLTYTEFFEAEPFGCSSVDVTFIADDGCGSTVTTTGTFTIIDTLNPSITTPAGNVNFECDGAGNVNQYNSYVSSNGGAVASDVCSVSLTWSNDAPATGPVGCGTQSIRFSVRDTCGGVSVTTGTFRISDTSAPTISPQASSQSAECDSTNNPIQIATWLLARGGASATDTCYATGQLIWTNNFSGVAPLPCGAITTVTFTVTDPCAQFSRTTASFTITDSSPPIITQEAQDIVIQCNPATNTADTLVWVNSRGGASAIDSCTTVTWSNTFVAPPDACTGPYDVDFVAFDQCGNRAISTASVTITDTIPPEFVYFPPDVFVECNEITDSSITGIPTFTDACTSNDVIRTESDVIFVEPYQRLCPGDTIITRTWRITDACGNFRERDQIIVVSIPTGPCTPQPCIPCDEQPLICCASSIAPVPCNPVPCTSVDCTHTSCSAVPCLPITCGNAAPPPFEDDTDTIAPSPKPQPSDCEPIYVYVFDDDDGYEEPPNNDFESRNSGSTLSVMLASILVALLILI